MKKFYLILFIHICFTTWASDKFLEPSLSFYSPRILGQGNTYVAEANGLESFEYNPAGLVEESSFTLFRGNFNLISNLVKMNNDLLLAYNEEFDSDKTSLRFSDLSFFMDSDNRSMLIEVLLKQASEPVDGSSYANGLGFAASMSMGFTGNGFGFGLLMSFDSEVYGTALHTTKLNNVTTSSILLGYGQKIDLGIISVDLGISIRPMYKIRSLSELSSVIELLMEESLTQSSGDFMKDLEYMTGVGIGVDFGAKVHFGGLTAGLSLIDVMGTKIAYSENSYNNIINGIFLGNGEIIEEYIIPSSIKLGFSYNPELGSLGYIISPTVSMDYNMMFIDHSIEDYVNQGNFWTNLSIGTNVEFFSFLSARAGLNQGYFTMGLGIEFFIIEIDAAIYSKELGKNPGDRQQMGAALEIAVRF